MILTFFQVIYEDVKSLLKDLQTRDERMFVVTIIFMNFARTIQKLDNTVTIVADTFKSAETTAKWEMELSDIAQGKSSKEKFLEAIETQIKEVFLTYIK